MFVFNLQSVTQASEEEEKWSEFSCHKSQIIFVGPSAVLSNAQQDASNIAQYN